MFTLAVEDDRVMFRMCSTHKGTGTVCACQNGHAYRHPSTAFQWEPAESKPSLTLGCVTWPPYRSANKVYPSGPF